MKPVKFLLVLTIAQLICGVGVAQAAGFSNNWNNAWTGQDANSRSATVQQANAIALRDSGYYDSFGPANSTTNIASQTIVNNNQNSQNTTSIGAMNQNSLSVGVTGSGNSLSTNSTSNSSSSNRGALQSTIDVSAP